MRILLPRSHLLLVVVVVVVVVVQIGGHSRGQVW